MSNTTLRHELSASGSGRPNLGDLAQLITQAQDQGAPATARVELTAYDDPRESGWSISIEWTAS